MAPRSVVLIIVVLGAAAATAYVGAPSGSHSAVASRRAVVAPCKTDQLSGSDAGPDGVAAGTVYETFALHTEKTWDCLAMHQGVDISTLSGPGEV